MVNEVAATEPRTQGYDRSAIGFRLDAERHRAIPLGDIREAFIGALPGIVGYFFGSILPTLLGAPAVVG